MFAWKGVFPAIITPFTADDRLDLPLFEKNLGAQITAGIDGVILGGTLGESSVLTQEEKASLTACALDKAAGRIPVVMNIAEGATREAVRAATEAEKSGVQGLMLLPPMRYAADAEETVTFLRAVAEATALPVMIYNNPVDYKTLISPDMFEALAATPNITAVKDSTRDVTNVTRMRNRFGERYRILCGVDTLALESLLAGADGWVGGLVDAFPAETVALCRLALAGRVAEAVAIHRWFLPLLELDLHPKLVQYIKLAATRTGIGSEYVRPPRLPLTGEERIRIMGLVDEAIRSRPALPELPSQPS